MQQTIIDGRYTLWGVLGDGGMARVHLAHDDVLDRDVALKILREQFADDDEFVERFRREARSAAALSHPNVVQVYDQNRAEDGSYYMAMEYVPGGTLKDRIAGRGPLGPEEAVGVALRVAEALAAAHSQGIVHRDIKPQNVLLTESGEAKVADFGIARAASAATISGSSMVLGTVGYMSPEQAMGRRAGPPSDLYSLGVVLYEMLTGELPFEADTPVAVAVKHLHEPPRHPRGANPAVPEGLDTLTVKLLAKDPEDRYENAAELAEDLRRIQAGKSPVAASASGATRRFPPAGAPYEAPTIVAAHAVEHGTSGRQRRRALRTAVAAVVVALVFGGAAWTVEQAPWDREAGQRAAQVLAEPLRTEVPDVVGLGQDEARERLSAAGFGVEVREEESSETDVGKVLKQSADAGEKVEEGSTITLTVGRGPSKVEVPDLIYPLEAEEQLADAGLKLGSVTKAPSDTVAAGIISAQDPAEGEKAERGTEVDMTISTGPAPAPPVQSAPPPQEPAAPQPQQPAPQPQQPAPQPEPNGQQESAAEPPPDQRLAPPQQQPSGSPGPVDPAASEPQQPPSGGEIVDDVLDDVGVGD